MTQTNLRLAFLLCFTWAVAGLRAQELSAYQMLEIGEAVFAGDILALAEAPGGGAVALVLTADYEFQLHRLDSLGAPERSRELVVPDSMRSWHREVVGSEQGVWLIASRYRDRVLSLYTAYVGEDLQLSRIALDTTHHRASHKAIVDPLTGTLAWQLSTTRSATVPPAFYVRTLGDDGPARGFFPYPLQGSGEAIYWDETGGLVNVRYASGDLIRLRRALPHDTTATQLPPIRATAFGAREFRLHETSGGTRIASWVTPGLPNCREFYDMVGERQIDEIVGYPLLSRYAEDYLIIDWETSYYTRSYREGDFALARRHPRGSVTGESARLHAKPRAYCSLGRERDRLLGLTGTETFYALESERYVGAYTIDGRGRSTWHEVTSPVSVPGYRQLRNRSVGVGRIGLDYDNYDEIRYAEIDLEGGRVVTDGLRVHLSEVDPRYGELASPTFGASHDGHVFAKYISPGFPFLFGVRVLPYPSEDVMQYGIGNPSGVLKPVAQKFPSYGSGSYVLKEHTYASNTKFEIINTAVTGAPLQTNFATYGESNSARTGPSVRSFAVVGDRALLLRGGYNLPSGANAVVLSVDLDVNARLDTVASTRIDYSELEWQEQSDGSVDLVILREEYRPDSLGDVYTLSRLSFDIDGSFEKTSESIVDQTSFTTVAADLVNAQPLTFLLAGGGRDTTFLRHLVWGRDAEDKQRSYEWITAHTHGVADTLDQTVISFHDLSGSRTFYDRAGISGDYVYSVGSGDFSWRSRIFTVRYRRFRGAGASGLSAHSTLPQLRAAPNPPVAGQVIISGRAAADLALALPYRLVDLQGRVLASGTWAPSAEELRIETTGLAAGQYFVVVEGYAPVRIQVLARD